MQIYDELQGEWIEGRVEHGARDYYWTNDDFDMELYKGLMVRVER